MANSDYSAFVPVTGTILNMSMGNDCCSQMMSVATGNAIVNFLVDSATQVIDGRRLRPGMQIAAFYDSSLPVPLIFPPQYRAQIVSLIGRNEQVMIGKFDSNLLSDDGSLQLNVSRNTVIKTINGQNFTCNLGNRTLLVFYSATTRSMPPQTTPGKIIVLC